MWSKIVCLLLGLVLSSTVLAADGLIEFSDLDVALQLKMGQLLSHNICVCHDKACSQRTFAPFEQWIIYQSRVKIPNDLAAKIRAYEYAQQMQDDIISGMTCFFKVNGLKGQALQQALPKTYDYQKAIAGLKAQLNLKLMGTS